MCTIYSVYVCAPNVRVEGLYRKAERKRECVCMCVWLPSSMGTFRPQNSTVSFKNELGIQWYTLSRLSSGVDGSWGQFSNLDAWIHWLILVGSGQESTLWTHFGKLAPLHDVQFMKIIWKKKMLNRFKEKMTIDKLAPADVKSGFFFFINWYYFPYYNKIYRMVKEILLVSINRDVYTIRPRYE